MTLQDRLDSLEPQPVPLCGCSKCAEKAYSDDLSFNQTVLQDLLALLPEKRVNLDKEIMPYASGQANGWNDVIGVIEKAIKEYCGVER